MNSRKAYSDVLIRHYRNPANRGRLEHETSSRTGHNPKCGDTIHLSLKLNDDGSVEDIRFDGSGCMIILASASILSDVVKNMPVSEMGKLIRHMESLQESGRSRKDAVFHDLQPVSPEIRALENIAREFPARSQCVTLPWQTLDKLLSDAR